MTKLCIDLIDRNIVKHISPESLGDFVDAIEEIRALCWHFLCTEDYNDCPDEYVEDVQQICEVVLKNALGVDHLPPT